MKLVIIPFQDILLDSSSRMNKPASREEIGDGGCTRNMMSAPVLKWFKRSPDLQTDAKEVDSKEVENARRSYHHGSWH